jgi:hypothetical protein
MYLLEPFFAFEYPAQVQLLQNLNNLLSSAQEELKQNTVMPSE